MVGPLPQDPRPMVLMLGWLGSQLRYFEKYAAMWRALGVTPIGHRPTILQTAIPSLADHVLHRFMGDVVALHAAHCKAHGGMQPLLIHTFSNAGFMALGTMLHLTSLLRGLPQEQPGQADHSPEQWPSDGSNQQLDSDRHAFAQPLSNHLNTPLVAHAPSRHQRRLLQDPAAVATLHSFQQVLGHTRGVVVDSAPSLPHPDIWTRGVLSAALQKPASTIEATHPWAMHPLRGLTAAYLRSKPVRQRMEEIQQGWLHELPRSPQLYLYSKADALIPPHHVRFFMRLQREYGSEVSSKCWQDSQHCEHMRAHPQEYMKVVKDFMHSCLTPAGG